MPANGKSNATHKREEQEQQLQGTLNRFNSLIEATRISAFASLVSSTYQTAWSEDHEEPHQSSHHNHILVIIFCAIFRALTREF